MQSISKLFSVILAMLMSFLSMLMPKNVVLPEIAQSDAALSCGRYTVDYDTNKGAYAVAKDGVTLFADARCAYIRDGETVTSGQYDHFELSRAALNDGEEMTVRMTGDGLWEMTQSFRFYADREYFTTRVSLSEPDGTVETNYIAPLVITNGSIQNKTYRWEKVLEVPFDNDGWVEFAVKGVWNDTASYEVGALFTPDDGNGLVLGSLEHDLWKSGVTTTGNVKNIKNLTLYSGAVDPRTGGESHGAVSGERVASALMFIGAFDHWKDGMNTFARANTEITPKRAAVTESVPFGWNSWGSVQDKINYRLAVDTSDYIKENLQPHWQTAGEAVYVNLDSWWDMLSDDELKAFVERCHANGQKAGIYSAPFVMWWDDYGMSVNYVPGTDNTITYQDIRLKKRDGGYYGNELDGCLPLDVTHPATRLHVKNQIDKFKAAGFDYIKLDFLVHASLEGDFYDASVQTGIQAYNEAMRWLTELIGDDLFINLAMSPTFPYCYANGRRLACDAFYSIGETEYTLNAVTYGFWEKELYDYTDPDHIVVWGKDGKASAAEARSRVTSGVIAGTSFLTGDNFITPAGDASAADARYKTLLTNDDVIAVAQIGNIFTPVIDNALARAANVYKMTNGDKEYIAVFNYAAVGKWIKVTPDAARYAYRELWSGKTGEADGSFRMWIGGKDALLFEITAA